MAKYEDLIDRVRDLDEELAEELEAFKGSSLRKAAERSTELESENVALKAKLTELEEAPKREQAFRDYGVDLDGLKPAEKQVLKSLKLDGELTQERISEIVREYEFPMIEGSQSTEGEGPSAAEVVSRAAQNPGQAARATTLTPADMSEWATDKLMRFREKYHEEFEALKKGESVTGSFQV